MVVITGTRFVGDVDHVPGLFRVATRCHHLYYVPLIPTGTHLVLDFTEEDVTKWWNSGTRTIVQTIPLPWSWKSLGMAYLRAALGLGVIAALVMAFVAGMSGVWFAAAAASGFLLWFSRLWVKASRARALELGAMAGIPRDLVLRYVDAPAKKTSERPQPLPRAQLVSDQTAPRSTTVVPAQPPPPLPAIAPGDEPRLLV
jgi:hypothetical protein